MENEWVGAGLAFLAGAAVAAVNDAISRAVLTKKPSMLASSYILRQAINVAYLAALYFLSKVLPWDMAYLLIGGALGVTLPSMFFTLRLARLNGARAKEDAKKEGEDNG